MNSSNNNAPVGDPPPEKVNAADWPTAISAFRTAAEIPTTERIKKKKELGAPAQNAIPNLPSFAEVLLARNAALPPATASASAAAVLRGVAFWDLGFPYWTPPEFYNLVMSELDPFAQSVVLQTDVRSLRDFLEILAIVAPKHSLPAIWEAANEG